MVRAKFRVQRIERSIGTVWNAERGAYEQTEIQTIVLTPVVSSELESENAKFYAATPGGQITLATVKAAAAAEFGLEREFYVDFTLVTQ